MENPNEAKVVRFTNIFDFDYTHAYGGVPYLLRAGTTQLFPWVIGDHLATHLARQALIRKAPYRDDNATDGRGGESTRSDRPLWDDTAIDELKAKIVKDAYVEERLPPVSEEQRLANKVAELAKQYPDAAAVGGPALVSASPLPIAPTVDAVITTSAPASLTDNKVAGYKDKLDVIAELNKRGIAHNPRSSKANLEKLLV